MDSNNPSNEPFPSVASDPESIVIRKQKLKERSAKHRIAVRETERRINHAVDKKVQNLLKKLAKKSAKSMRQLLEELIATEYKKRLPEMPSQPNPSIEDHIKRIASRKKKPLNMQISNAAFEQLTSLAKQIMEEKVGLLIEMLILDRAHPNASPIKSNTSSVSPQATSPEINKDGRIQAEPEAPEPPATDPATASSAPAALDSEVLSEHSPETPQEPALKIQLEPYLERSAGWKFNVIVTSTSDGSVICKEPLNIETLIELLDGLQITKLLRLITQKKLNNIPRPHQSEAGSINTEPSESTSPSAIPGALTSKSSPPEAL